MARQVWDTALSQYEATPEGRQSIVETSLHRLAISLGSEAALDTERLRIMAEDLARTRYTLEEILHTLMEWRTGLLPLAPLAEMMEFPCTPQIVNCLRNKRGFDSRQSSWIN